jgi:hypothetical protein
MGPGGAAGGNSEDLTGKVTVPRDWHCSWLIRKCQHLAKSRISRIQAIESRLLIKYLIHMHAILEILDSGASGGPVNEARNGGDC